jgi:hypothetical protein
MTWKNFMQLTTDYLISEDSKGIDAFFLAQIYDKQKSTRIPYLPLLTKSKINQHKSTNKD